MTDDLRMTTLARALHDPLKRSVAYTTLLSVQLLDHDICRELNGAVSPVLYTGQSSVTSHH